MSEASEDHISVKDLTMAFGDFVVMHDLTFTVKRGNIFFIIGGSGCGKSTLFRHMVRPPPARRARRRRGP